MRINRNIFSLIFLVGIISAQSVYIPPAWAKNAIWYQIFPERFRNGDAANDPTPKDMLGAWPYQVSEGWQITPWNSDWYKLQPWEQQSKNFYDNFAQRRYGGDIQGILDKLDYLHKLGITAIYLNPVFESPSLHKYDASFYHHIDDNFGPDPVKDKEIWTQENPADPTTWKWTTADLLFLKLISEAHKRNMKIIIDGVFNHTGTMFWAFQSIQKFGKNSPYESWYTIKQFDDTATTINEFDYEGWYGVKDLPEFREDENGLLQGPNEHIHAVVKRWMDPNGDGNPSDGIDGWRLDVASQVNIKFWKDFRRWTREINPESYLVGEVWWEDWSNNKIYDPAPWISDGAVFDAVMNYRLMVPVLDYFTNKEKKINSSTFAERITSLIHQFPADVTQVQMNTIDSHDTDRLPSIIVNPDRWFDHVASAKDNPQYDVRKPNKDEISIFKLVVLHQFTTVGAPTIYYGDESGMWGGDDPDERKPMVWDDIQYESEAGHPIGKSRPIDPVAFDNDLFKYYQKIISIRKAHPSLSVGEFSIVKSDDGKDIVVYKRASEKEEMIICINNSSSPQNIHLPAGKIGKIKVLTDLMSSKKYLLKRDAFNFTMEPKSGAILKADKKNSKSISKKK